MFIQLSITISMCNHLYLSWAKPEFILMSQLQSIITWIILDFSLCLLVTSGSTGRNLAPTVCHSFSEIIRCQYMFTVSSKLLICTPVGENIYQLDRVQCLCSVSIAVSLTGPSHFHSYLAFALLPPPEWDCSYICNTVRLFCYFQHSVLGSRNLLNDLLKISIH